MPVVISKVKGFAGRRSRKGLAEIKVGGRWRPYKLTLAMLNTMTPGSLKGLLRAAKGLRIKTSLPARFALGLNDQYCLRPWQSTRTLEPKLRKYVASDIGTMSDPFHPLQPWFPFRYPAYFAGVFASTIGAAFLFPAIAFISINSGMALMISPVISRYVDDARLENGFRVNRSLERMK